MGSNPLCLVSFRDWQGYINTQRKGLVKTWGEDARFRVSGLVCLFDYFLIVEERDIFPVLPGSGSGYPVFSSLRPHCCNPFHLPHQSTRASSSWPLLRHLPMSAFLILITLGAGTGFIRVFSFVFLMATGRASLECFTSHLYIFFLEKHLLQPSKFSVIF